jgi:4-amino-4-deoxy-L-arabinose transferase-like glycosyltransferase
LLNPVIWFFNSRISGAFPDTISYLVLADAIFQEGKLFVEHWGHIDSGLILPPVYSALISLGNFLSDDSLRNAQLVSLTLILLSIFPLFYFLKSYTTRSIAFVAVLGVQLNYFYPLYGFAALTEAAFIFMLSMGFWLLSKALSEGKSRWLFCLGIFACLVFLTRQIGGVFIIFSCFLFLLPLFEKGGGKGKAVRDLFVIMAGFLVVMTPYSLALYGQSGQHPFTQWFRLMEYSVPVNAAPAQKVSLEGFGDQSEYYQTWVKRRIERQLIPDASEMYSFLISEQKESILDSVLSTITNSKRLTENTVNNFNYLKEATGLPLLLLFMLIPLSIFRVRVKDVSLKLRLVLPGFILLYWIIVTLLTGSVGRYIHVLFPFVSLSVLMEAYYIFRFLSEKGIRNIRPEIMTILLCVFILFSTPKYFTSLDFNDHTGGDVNPLKECGKFIKKNDSVFSFHQNNVYLLGGNYRTLPNDSLERVSMYAEKTGVEWLLYVDSDADQYELEHYFLSDWRNHIINLHKTYPEYVSLQCANSEQNILLYKFIR